MAVCKENTVQLGTPADPELTYTWSPSNAISVPLISQTRYSIQVVIANLNPLRLLTASVGGCSFTDEVEVSVLTADAGEDNVCGLRLLGWQIPCRM